MTYYPKYVIVQKKRYSTDLKKLEVYDVIRHSGTVIPGSNFKYSCLSCFKAGLLESNFKFTCTHHESQTDKYLFGVLDFSSHNRVELVLVSIFDEQTLELESTFCAGVFAASIGGSVVFCFQGYTNFFPEIDYKKIIINQPNIGELAEVRSNFIYYNNMYTVSTKGFSVYSSIRTSIPDVQCLKISFPYWLGRLFINKDMITSAVWYTIQKEALKKFEQLLQIRYNIKFSSFLLIPFVGAFMFIDAFIYPTLKNIESSSIHNVSKADIFHTTGALCIFNLEQLWQDSWMAILKNYFPSSFYLKNKALWSLGATCYCTLWHLDGAQTANFVYYISDCLEYNLYSLEWVTMMEYAYKVTSALQINFRAHKVASNYSSFSIADITSRKLYNQYVIFDVIYEGGFRRDFFFNNIKYLHLEETVKITLNYNKTRSISQLLKSKHIKKFINEISILY